MTVRAELVGDREAIHAVIDAAFRASPHGEHGEAAIVDALRAAGTLTVSLVADLSGVVAHVAFSPVTIAGRPSR